MQFHSSGNHFRDLFQAAIRALGELVEFAGIAVKLAYALSLGLIGWWMGGDMLKAAWRPLGKYLGW